MDDGRVPSSQIVADDVEIDAIELVECDAMGEREIISVDVVRGRNDGIDAIVGDHFQRDEMSGEIAEGRAIEASSVLAIGDQCDVFQRVAVHGKSPFKLGRRAFVYDNIIA